MLVDRATSHARPLQNTSCQHVIRQCTLQAICELLQCWLRSACGLTSRRASSRFTFKLMVKASDSPPTTD
eukprot:4795289-Amphidinium_carterae.1